MNRVSFRRLLLPLLLVLVAAPAGGAVLQVPGAEWLVGEIKALSAPDTEGRGAGTPGAEVAARRIAGVFAGAGLVPAGDGGSFRQAFVVPTGIRLASANALTVLSPAPRSLTLGRDFAPLATSANGAVEGDVVFAGYGITAADLQYDDYAGLDVKDKVVLVLTGEPRATDPASPFRRPEAYHYSERSHKVINARLHGARAALLVERPSSRAERLPALRGLAHSWGIPAVVVTRATAEALLASSGKQLGDLADAIDRALAPQSMALAGSRVRVEVELVREHATTVNVVGVLPGTDARLRHEAVVIGAHYDHLGRGGEGSLAPDAVGAIHPGADDNASGTAVVMALARAFAASGGTPRSLVFVAFSGEEMGLLGSSWYVNHPAVPLDRTVLMLNLDMVGRLKDGKLYVGGVDSGTGLRAVVADAQRGLGLRAELRGDPFAPSDHTAFYTAGRPVLFFFTGAHADYHRPTDTWEKIDGAGLEQVATVAARVVDAVARQSTPPAYVKVTAPPPARGRSGGYGPFFGVVPDFAGGDHGGVKISGVRAGSPAEKAGVQPGDVIVRFGGVPVKTLDDLTFVLRGKRAGDQVDVVLVRGGREQTVEAILEERR